MCDKELVFSLVRAYLLHNPDYLTWVPSYTVVKWSKNKAQCIRVGGHYRRKAMYSQLLKSLTELCNLQELSYPKNAAPPPPRAIKELWSKDGQIIPLRLRQLVLNRHQATSLRLC